MLASILQQWLILLLGGMEVHSLVTHHVLQVVLTEQLSHKNMHGANNFPMKVALSNERTSLPEPLSPHQELEDHTSNTPPFSLD